MLPRRCLCGDPTEALPPRGRYCCVQAADGPTGVRLCRKVRKAAKGQTSATPPSPATNLSLHTSSRDRLPWRWSRPSRKLLTEVVGHVGRGELPRLLALGANGDQG